MWVSGLWRFHGGEGLILQAEGAVCTGCVSVEITTDYMTSSRIKEKSSFQEKLVYVDELKNLQGLSQMGQT